MANVGSAIPIANTLEILGTAVAAVSIPLQTVGSGNTISVQVQYASSTASSVANNAGIASFNSTDFTVDANGFVSVSAVAGSTQMGVDASTPPGTNPVVPSVLGVITVTGGQVAAGTTANVIRTNSLAANEYTIQIQRSQAVASSSVADNGVSHFDSAYFTVDGNGFVSLSGSAVGQTITGDSGGALSPTAGNWDILGALTASGATPVQTSGSGSTLTIQVQTSQAIDATNASNVGLAAFDSTYFTVDANGFVSVNGTGLGETITGDIGGALSPTDGNWNILGAATVAGSTPVQTSGSGSTLTVQVQTSQAIAGTDATKIGLAAFSSADFSVDSNGFVSLAASGAPFTWQLAPASPTALVANNGYNPTASGTLTFTLPAACAYGEIIEIGGYLSTAWIITQGAGQSVLVDARTSTVGVGGSVASTASWNNIRLLCVVANTTFMALGHTGNLTVT